jgi:hypothetical protein
MNNSLMTWLGQITTGHGVMILVPTILSMLTGTMTVATGAPLLLAGVIGLLWPETRSDMGAAPVIPASMSRSATPDVVQERRPFR